jgi:hypothetical protein
MPRPPEPLTNEIKENAMNHLFRPYLPARKASVQRPEDRSAPAGSPKAQRTPEPYHDALKDEPSWTMELCPSNPNQPVDARWRLAVNHVQNRFRDTTDRDEPTTRAIDFLYALVACADEAQRERLAQDMPAMDAAYRLHRTEDKLARGLLEARLLTRMPFAEVATSCEISEETVQLYHDLYMNVRSKLHLREWIVDRAIGEKAWYGIKEEDVDVFLKHLGFLKGPFMIQALERYFREGLKIPDTLEGLTREQLVDLKLKVGARSVILIRVLPPEKSQRAWLLHELEQRLQTLIASWSDDTRPLGQASLLAAITPAEQEQWWREWRKVAVAAHTGKKPKGKKKASVA